MSSTNAMKIVRAEFEAALGQDRVFIDISLAKGALYDFTATVASVVVFVVDDTELARCHSMDFLVGMQVPIVVGIFADLSTDEFGGMAYLERDWQSAYAIAGKRNGVERTGYEVEVGHAEMVFIYLLGIVAMTDK